MAHADHAKAAETSAANCRSWEVPRACGLPPRTLGSFMRSTGSEPGRALVASPLPMDRKWNQAANARAETGRLRWRSQSVTLVLPVKRRPARAADATNLNMCFIDKVVDRLTWPPIYGSIEQQLSTISVLLAVLHD